MTKEQAIRLKRELELIRRANPEGRLRPEEIVEYARDKQTELHRHFEWNDSVAAQAYRMVQARDIIRVQVTVLDPGEGHETEVRAFVSLLPGSGYTETVDVFSNKRSRRELIEKILDRMLALAQSYAMPELKPVIHSIGLVRSGLIAKRKGRPPTRRTSSRDRRDKDVRPSA